MELMARFLRSPWGTFYLGCAAATLTGIAVLGFGAPPTTVIWVAWGGGVLVSAADTWARRRLKR